MTLKWTVVWVSSQRLTALGHFQVSLAKKMHGCVEMFLRTWVHMGQ